jgi:hypothetical protein
MKIVIAATATKTLAAQSAFLTMHAPPMFLVSSLSDVMPNHRELQSSARIN